MAISLVSRYLVFSFLFIFFATVFPFETLDATPTSPSPPPPLSSFSFEGFEKNQSFNPDIALYGDAEIGDSGVRITRPAISSRGRIMCRKPIRFLGTKPGFSTYFSFSISPGNGDGLGLAFLLIPSSVRMESIDRRQSGFSPGCILSVTYAASRGANPINRTGNQIEINVGGEIATKSSDLSTVNLVLNSGEKLHSWIDYCGESKRVEVRLSKSKTPRPSDSLVSYPIDLSGLLWRETLFVGISSSTGNSTQTTSVYSWNFTRKHGAQYLMHSEPLDPHSFLVKTREDPPIHLRRAYPWRNLMSFVFGVAFGILVAFIVLFVYPAMFYRSPITPVAYLEHTIESGNEKIVLVGDKGVDSAGTGK